MNNMILLAIIGVSVKIASIVVYQFAEQRLKEEELKNTLLQK
jgi:hypothetical protein